MERWVLYAFISMFFAGFTAVIGKQGLSGISSELGLTIRTIFVFFFVLIFAAMFVSPSEVRNLQKTNYLWLGVSGLAAALSWIFYYKALKVGDVVTFRYYESVVYAIQKPGEKAPAAAAGEVTSLKATWSRSVRRGWRALTVSRSSVERPCARCAYRGTRPVLVLTL